MNTWTKTLSGMVVIWAGAVTAATQDARAPQPSTQLRGRVVSANPAYAVAGATVHLVPVAAIDTTTKMTASAIYAAPYPAEAYDEPLEDAILSKGAGIPHATTDARGNFAIAASARREILRPRDAECAGHRASARWGSEPAELCCRPVAWPADDHQVVESSVDGGALRRQLGVPGLS